MKSEDEGPRLTTISVAASLRSFKAKRLSTEAETSYFCLQNRYLECCSSRFAELREFQSACALEELSWIASTLFSASARPHRFSNHATQALHFGEKPELGFRSQSLTMQALHLEEVASWIRSLGWCDTGVGLSPMLTEAFNTISNIPGIILALIGFINAVHMRFEYRFKILHLVSIAVGLASMFLHCSLKVRQQHKDEVPMVWIMLVYIYTLYSPDIHYAHFKPVLRFILVMYAGAFAVLHSIHYSMLVFELHYVFLILVCAPGMVNHYISTTDSLALRLAHQYLLCFSCAIMIWGVDQKLCNRESTLPVHPFWHAVFHVLNGVNNYFGNMFLQYSRTRQLGLEPELRYIGGILPYVKVIAKNRRTIAIVHEENVQNDKED